MTPRTAPRIAPGTRPLLAVHGRHRSRAAATVAFATTFALAQQVPAAAAAPVADAWGPPITFVTGEGAFATPIHASLLPDGRILLIGSERDTRDAPPGEPNVDLGRRAAWVMAPTPLGAPFPAEVPIQRVVQPVELDGASIDGFRVTDNLFCAGQVLLADGRVLTVGGTRVRVDESNGARTVRGLPYATLFDGTTWTRPSSRMTVPGPLGAPERWYPTVTRLASGRVLVTSGFDQVEPTGSVNLSTEIFDPASSTFAPHTAVGGTPVEIISSDYTHAVTLPTRLGSFDVLAFGEPGVPALLSTSSSPGSWFVRQARPRPGSDAWQAARRAAGRWEPATAPNNGASTAMLPIRVRDGEWGYRNGAVLIAGGAHGTAHGSAVDVYDPVANAWLPRLDTGVERHHPATVLLPDGRVLVLAGHGEDPGVTRATYVDPTRRFALSEGTTDSGIVRGYHNVSLLLPDGRVLVGGGRDVDTATSNEKVTFQYYHPHYVFAPRPRIVGAPTSVGYGAPFVVDTAGARPAEVVLVSLGSMTHSFDMGQRLVQVPLLGSNATAGGHRSLVLGPASADVAPPGHYMLFVLDGDRIPSVARIVRVG